MWMRYANCFTVLVGNTDKQIYLFSDKIGFLKMINKYISLSEWKLQEAGGWFAETFRCCQAVNEKQVSFFRIENI